MTELVATNNSQLAEDAGKSLSIEQCKNCETPLTGPFCSQCGQPSRSIIRFFGSLIKELLEDVISLDSRAFKTFAALLVRPGFLTNEYVNGKRFKYVPPLRLFLFSSILCIFALWLVNITSEDKSFIEEESDTVQQLTEETTTALFKDDPELLKKFNNKDFEDLSDQERESAIARLEKANEQLQSLGMKTIDIPKELLPVSEEIKLQKERIQKQVEQLAKIVPQDIDPYDRHEMNKALEQAFAELDDLSKEDQKAIRKQFRKEQIIRLYQDDDETNDGLQYNDGKFNAHFSFLTDEQNLTLSEKLTDKMEDAKADPKDFISDILELIPKTMLLLVPIFAILMRLVYPFAGRYYIEHLIHAFHGHAFLFLTILLATLIEVTTEQMLGSSNWFISALESILSFIGVVLFFWIPIYFLISLRVVYQQHWALTIFKWALLGVGYLVLFGFAALSVLILNVLI
ncbi:MAG: DUF3667 domain-containing protein [Kangiellaceae bacterium]|jgi:uncharacterized membrane protein (DUF106 family)|nr:DUF3667 domain-containing protein [Kangiellaceae bacterium]